MASKKKIRHGTPQPAPRRYRLWAILAVALVSLAIAYQYGWLARVPLARAEDAIADGDLQAAVRWIRISHILGAQSGRGEFLLARHYRRQGQLDDMASELRKAQAAGFDQERLERERLLALAQTGRLTGIETKLNDWLLNADPEDSREITRAYANGLSIQGRLDHAVALLLAWQEDFPRDAEPEYRLGRIRDHQRDRRQAEEHYRRALDKDPHYLPAAFSLGRLLLELKEVEEALVHFRLCEQELPDSAAGKVGVARCLKSLGQTDEAKRLLEEVVSLDADTLKASYRAVGESPESFLAAAELGKLEGEAGNFQQAERWLRESLEKNPRDLVARYAYAIALRGLGRTVEANEHFKQVDVAQKAMDDAADFHDRIDRNPDDIEARYGLGMIMLKYESERSGLYWLQSVLAKNPRHAPTHVAIGRYYESRSSESSMNAELARYHVAQAESARNESPAPGPELLNHLAPAKPKD